MSDSDEPTDDDAVQTPTRYGVPVVDGVDMPTLHVPREQWVTVAAALLVDGYIMCTDVTAVDYLTYAGHRRPVGDVVLERFEVVATFLDLDARRRIRMKTQLSADDPTVGSLYALYPGSDYLEREAYDMFGITFEGHPDLSRILMPETWEGHPLRKDFAVGAIPVQFKGAPGPR